MSFRQMLMDYDGAKGYRYEISDLRIFVLLKGRKPAGSCGSFKTATRPFGICTAGQNSILFADALVRS